MSIIPYPLVSICIPTFNGEEFINEAMDSAIAQTYRPLEIIVSDDASQDGTVDIVKSYLVKTDIPIHIYYHEPAGIGENWNNCVINSGGEYIKFLFQDDLLEPECVAELMKLALEHNKTGLVFCKRKILFDPQNVKQSNWAKEYKSLHTAWSDLRVFQIGRDLLIDKNFLNGPNNKVGEPVAVLIKKEVFVKLGYFNNTLKQLLDCEFWYRVFTRYNVAFSDKYLASFRLHNEQTTVKNMINPGFNEEYKNYHRQLYKNCYKYLHPRTKMLLLSRFHPWIIFASKVHKRINNRIYRRLINYILPQ